MINCAWHIPLDSTLLLNWWLVNNCSPWPELCVLLTVCLRLDYRYMRIYSLLIKPYHVFFLHKLNVRRELYFLFPTYSVIIPANMMKWRTAFFIHVAKHEYYWFICSLLVMAILSIQKKLSQYYAEYLLQWHCGEWIWLNFRVSRSSAIGMYAGKLPSVMCSGSDP